MPTFKRNLISRLCAPEGDGTGNGDGGGGGGSDDVQAQIRKAVEDAVGGLKSKNQELLGKLKESQETLKRFDGIDPDAVNNMLKRFADDEEAGLLKAGKIDEVLQKRTERMRADMQKQIEKRDADLKKATDRAQAFQGRVLDDAMRAAAAKAGLHPHAIDDALLRGRSIFSLNDDGQAVQVGEDGQPVLGKDGKNPFTPLEWLEGMKEKAPHWYPASASGGGGQGSSSTNAAGKKTMPRSQFDGLPQGERMAFSKAGGLVVD